VRKKYPPQLEFSGAPVTKTKVQNSIIGATQYFPVDNANPKQFDLLCHQFATKLILFSSPCTLEFVIMATQTDCFAKQRKFLDLVEDKQLRLTVFCVPLSETSWVPNGFAADSQIECILLSSHCSEFWFTFY
jgi:hypothetical protein